jgi:type IV pilus biogenesis protein CpaD/CtpE
VGEQVFRRDFRVKAEFLRQIPQNAAHRILLAQHVDVTQSRAAAVGLLQRSESSHQRGFACAVWPQQAEHSQRNIQRDITQCLRAVGITFGEILDSKFHRRSSIQ